jgi:TMEM175 potassium channel family protein
VVNLALIASIALLPFTTSSLGDPALEDAALPTVVLAINVAAASALHILVYLVASRRDLLVTRPTLRERSGQVLIGLTPAVVFLATIPIAYLASPQAAWLSWLSLIVLRPLVRREVARRTPAREGDPG